MNTRTTLGLVISALSTLLTGAVLRADHCCYYENETLTCMDVSGSEDCDFVGGVFDAGDCASSTCQAFCDYVPRIIRHGSVQSHNGTEYLIPSGQSECRFLDGNFEAFFEFERDAVGVCDDTSFCIEASGL